MCGQETRPVFAQPFPFKPTASRTHLLGKGAKLLNGARRALLVSTLDQTQKDVKGREKMHPKQLQQARLSFAYSHFPKTLVEVDGVAACHRRQGLLVTTGRGPTEEEHKERKGVVSTRPSSDQCLHLSVLSLYISTRHGYTHERERQGERRRKEGIIRDKLWLE